MPLDERATLTNMAVEAGGFTGIIEADEVVVDYLVTQRGLDAGDVRERIVVQSRSGRALRRRRSRSIFATIEPMVATPGDPRNGIPLRELSKHAADGVKIDIAYGGSCTGGKKADMDMYASVLGAAVDEGQARRRGRAPLHPVRLAGHPPLRRGEGLPRTFAAAGAELVDPSCGACIKAGPGVSFGPDQVTVSAINRNFPGRSGPGKVYLASPLVVAASAIAGRIVHPGSLEPA